MDQFKTRHLNKLEDGISVHVPKDNDGYFGRECPQIECEGYFKIMLGTGLTGENLPCHCPYCGHTASHDDFWTKPQIAYVHSVFSRKVADAFRKDLKQLEFEYKPPKNSFEIGLSMKLKPGSLPSIHYFHESKLETYLTCQNCTLNYAVYGIFGYCPDCRQHNSLQILETNLNLLRKVLELADSNQDVFSTLIESVLEKCVAVMDGFGKTVWELANLNAGNHCSSISFQNIEMARHKVKEAFGLDIAQSLSTEKWEEFRKLLQKRHLFAHSSGIVDQHYISRSGDDSAVVGRKVALTKAEILNLIISVKGIARYLSKQLL